jgi:hypothetical protein
MSNQIKSVSITIQPADSRCRYWAKLLKPDTNLPEPKNVNGANDIFENYLRKGDEELFEGDILIEGEEKHHRKNHGWSYKVSFVENGQLRIVSPSSELKAILKSNGLSPELLAGSGDVAACIRIAHAIHNDIKF